MSTDPAASCFLADPWIRALCGEVSGAKAGSGTLAMSSSRSSSICRWHRGVGDSQEASHRLLGSLQGDKKASGARLGLRKGKAIRLGERTAAGYLALKEAQWSRSRAR